MHEQHHLCSLVRTRNRFQALEEEADREDAARGDEGAESEVGGAGRRPLSAPPGPKRNRHVGWEPRAGGVRGSRTWLVLLGLTRLRARPVRKLGVREKRNRIGVRGNRDRLALLGLTRLRAGGMRKKRTWLVMLGLTRQRARKTKERRGGREAGGGRSASSERSSPRTRLGTKSGRSWR